MRPNSPAHPEPGQRILDDEQRRLSQGGLIQRVPRRFGFIRTIQRLAQVDSQFRLQDAGAFVYNLPEDAFVPIEIMAHVGVL